MHPPLCNPDILAPLTDEEELIATGKNPDDTLTTRMMYYDLKRFETN